MCRSRAIELNFIFRYLIFFRAVFIILICLGFCTVSGVRADSGGFDPVYDAQQKFRTHPDHYLHDYRDRDDRDDREDRVDRKRDERDDRDRRDRDDDDDDDNRKLIYRHDTWHDFDPREDFGKDSYRDLLDMRKPELRGDYYDRDKKKDDTGRDDDRDDTGDDDDTDDQVGDDHDPLHADGLRYLSDRDRRRLKEDEKKTFDELIKPYRGRFHDWVPAKVDRLQNGAFGKEPDNGFPVPYRLNGHLDIQRKLPWEAEPD